MMTELLIIPNKKIDDHNRFAIIDIQADKSLICVNTAGERCLYLRRK
jgi:hypothetical protein